MSLKLLDYLTDSMISCCTYPSVSAHEGGVTAQATSDQLLLSPDRISQGSSESLQILARAVVRSKQLRMDEA